MANNTLPAALSVVLLLCLAVLATSAGCLKESAVAVTDITVGADTVTGAEVTLNVTTETPEHPRGLHRDLPGPAPGI